MSSDPKSSDTDKDPSEPGLRVVPPDTERDLPGPDLRVIAGARSEGEPTQLRRHRFIDKDKRPLHRQLRLITVPPWLVWVGQLMQQRRAADRVNEEASQSTTVPPAPPSSARRWLLLGTMTGALLVVVGFVAVWVWQEPGTLQPQGAAHDEPAQGTLTASGPHGAAVEPPPERLEASGMAGAAKVTASRQVPETKRPVPAVAGRRPVAAEAPPRQEQAPSKTSMPSALPSALPALPSEPAPAPRGASPSTRDLDRPF